MMKPLCIDLYCGLGGWTEGFLAEGYDVIGFDIERRPYPAQLVLQDVLSLHGSQFKDATCIVASPPCQKYSWLAMPWSRSTTEHSQAAKALRRRWETEGPDNRLFDACFRIQREASESAGYHIPMVGENVRGAIPWVGPARWNFGSYYLWGDVPALMPIPSSRRMKYSSSCGPRLWKEREVVRLNDGESHLKGRIGGGQLVLSHAQRSEGRKASDPRRGVRGWFGREGGTGVTLQNGEWLTQTGVQIGGDWFSDPQSTCRKHGSRSQARKAASAQIAKIPFPLARHIAQCFKAEPQGER